MNESIISIKNLNKVYRNNFQALDDINLEIKKGEIFALLGPNGAGKTTLISAICGITQPTSGSVLVNGFDTLKDYRKTRAEIGLVPQELTTDAFETPVQTVHFSRGLFGKPKSMELVERILKSLSLWDKRDNKLMMLSGGMKRRVMIAKALAHEPNILFLDEPTAGVDVELRKDMWNQVRKLRDTGVTIILTTHYIEEAEEMADRIGVIHKGKIILVEEKNSLLDNLGTKQLRFELFSPLNEIPSSLSVYNLKSDGHCLTYTYDAKKSENGVQDLIKQLGESQIMIKDIQTKQSSLEEIFVELVKSK